MNITIKYCNWVCISPKVHSAHLKELTFDLWFHSGQEKRSLNESRRSSRFNKTHSPLFFFFYFSICHSPTKEDEVCQYTQVVVRGKKVWKFVINLREMQENCVSLLGRSRELTPCVLTRPHGQVKKCEVSFVEEGCKVLAGQLQLLSWWNGKKSDGICLKQELLVHNKKNKDCGMALPLCLNPPVEPNEQKNSLLCVCLCVCVCVCAHALWCCGGGFPFGLLGNCFVRAAFHRRAGFPVTMAMRAFLLFPSHQSVCFSAVWDEA